MSKKKLDGLELMKRARDHGIVPISDASLFTKLVIASYLNNGWIEQEQDSNGEVIGYRLARDGRRALEWAEGK